MARPRLVKLVRDKMARSLASNEVEYVPLNDPELHKQLLRRKLVEEAIEYLEDPCAEEAADVIAVMDALIHVDLGTTWVLVREIAAAKFAERGGFEEGFGMYVQTTASRERVDEAEYIHCPEASCSGACVSRVDGQVFECGLERPMGACAYVALHGAGGDGA